MSLPALSCCLLAADSSDFDSSSAGCLKTTGARDIVPGALEESGSRRFA